MPFTKPKFQNYKIIAVGEKLNELTQIFHEFWTGKQTVFSENQANDKWSYVYTRNGCSTKV